MSRRPRLRVCVVHPSGTRGGAEIWQERLADESTRLDLDVVVLAEGECAQAWRDRGVPVIVVTAGRGGKGVSVATLRLARHLRQVRPDIVLGHGVKAGLVAALAGHLSGTRSAWVRHDDSFSGPLVSCLDRLVDTSISTDERLVRGRARPGVVVAPHLGGAPFSRAEACQALGLPELSPRLRVGMATRLSPEKGVDDAIRALALAPRWVLHVYGIADTANPDEPTRLRELAAQMRVTDRLHLHQRVDDVGRCLAALDVVAVLTRDDPGSPVAGEGYGLAAHEAMRCGVPVVCTPPLDQHLGDAAIGVPGGNPAAVAAALTALEDRGARQRLGQHGLAHQARAHAADGTEVTTRHLANTARRPGAGLDARRPVSVVTTVLDEPEGLDRLLTALRIQLAVDDELLVVDGGSAAPTLEAARRHAALDPRVQLVETGGAGISAGRNVGIARARHELVACTDVGCDPAPGWLDALRAAAEDLPDAGLLTGVYDVSSASPLQSALAAVGYPVVDELTHPTPVRRVYGRLFGRTFDATMPTGRSMAVTREAWRAAGGFPEHLATGEDVTFGRAVARRHPAHLVSDALVTWEQRPTLRGTVRMYYRYGQGSGHSRDRRLLLRDGSRAAAYLVGGVLLTTGPRGRATAVAGALVYLSVPLHRALAKPSGPLAALLVPPVTVLRDGAKVAGAVTGLITGRDRAGDR